MYSKYRTLTQTLSLINPRIDLPRDAVLDALILKVAVEITNKDTADYTATNEALLRAIQEIRVVSDGSTVHYALSGADVALLNRYNSMPGFGIDLSEPITVPKRAEGEDEGKKTFTYMLRLDEGDILAASKDALELRIIMNPSLGGNITISALNCTVTLIENVLTPQEFIQTYGPNLEYAAEPKVYALTVPVMASTELTNVLDLPTGSLARAAVLQFMNSETGRLDGTADPASIALINTSPDRREVLHVDWQTLQAINTAEYNIGAGSPMGVALLNYAKDVTCDGYGLRGWRYVKGDWQIAAKTGKGGTLRYLCLEHVVSATVFDVAEHAIIEATS